MRGETAGELRQDVVLGLGFLVLAVGTLRRLRASAGQSGSETVITTFYSLIFFTSIVRAIWFLVPTSVLMPSYAPVAEYAFKGEWIGTYASEMLLFLGSLSLFSIFILIAIYWADLLKKIFRDNASQSRPMASFTKLAACLAAVQGLNSCLFFARVYSSQGMLLFDSALLTVLSLVCSVEISRFSYRFRTVLKTLGAINQVSTDAQVTRIVRITVTGNLFFAVRGACELTIGLLLYRHYKRYKSFDIVFNTRTWEWYILIRHTSEWLILFLMLWILHSPQQDTTSSEYSPFPDDDTDPLEEGNDEGGGVSQATGGGSGGEHWGDNGNHARHAHGPAGREPLTGGGRRVDEYGAI